MVCWVVAGWDACWLVGPAVVADAVLLPLGADCVLAPARLWELEEAEEGGGMPLGIVWEGVADMAAVRDVGGGRDGMCVAGDAVIKLGRSGADAAVFGRGTPFSPRSCDCRLGARKAGRESYLRYERVQCMAALRSRARFKVSRSCRDWKMQERELGLETDGQVVRGLVLAFSCGRELS